MGGCSSIDYTRTRGKIIVIILGSYQVLNPSTGSCYVMRVSRPLIQSSVSSEDDFPFFFLPSGFSAWAHSSFSLRGTTIIYIFFVV